MSIIDRIRDYREVLRFTPFDVTTEDGRSKERHRRIVLTAFTSAVAKVITITASFITVPLTLNYLGTERYGLWMTISSMIAMMVFADFGIGNGLMNAISEAFGKDDKIAIKAHITNATVILSGIAILILIIFFIVFPHVSWGYFFNVRTQLAIDEAGPVLAVFMVCFAIGVPASIVQRVQMGLQQGFASSLWQAGGSIFGLLLTLLVIFFKGDLFWLVLALAGSPVVFLLLNGIFFFSFKCKELKPDLRQATKNGMKHILHGGLLFFVLQIACSISYASDNLILAKILGADAVAQYSVVSKLFEGILMVQALAISPLWPAYTEAKSRGDKGWIKKTLSKSMWLTLLAIIPIAILLVVGNKPIFSLWVGSQHAFSFALVALYGVWMVLKALGATYSMFLNGLNVLRVQLIIASMFTFFSIVMKIGFVHSFGLNGLLIALVVSYSLTTILPYTMLTSKILSNNS